MKPFFAYLAPYFPAALLFCAGAALPAFAAQPVQNYLAVDLSYTGNGASTSIQSDSSFSAGEWVGLSGTGAGQSISYTLPNIPAGSYRVLMQWKGNTNRGQLTLSVDGSQVGGPLDQYSSKQNYPTTAFGNVTFGSTGNHTAVLSVAGKNSSSSGYNLSTYQFILVPVAASVATTWTAANAVNLSYTGNGAPTSVQSDAKTSGGAWVQLAATSVGQSISFTTPSIPPGVYQLLMEWKGNTNRGQMTLSIDGKQAGGPLDQYAATQTYPTSSFGYVTCFTTGSHTITLTVSGKNAISSGYYLSADKFVFSPGAPTNGNPILPPKWAFGILHGCYADQSGVLSAAANLRNGVSGSGPFAGDMLWVDSTWLSSDFAGPASAYIDYAFDSAQYSNPGSMISTLHAQNVHFGTWEWPWISTANSLYNTGAANHYFIETSSGAVAAPSGVWHGLTNGTTGQFDLSTTPGLNWWMAQNQTLFYQLGFDFIKIDAGWSLPSGGVLANGSASNTDWLGFYHSAAHQMTTTANSSQGRGLILAHSDTGPATNSDQYPGEWTGDVDATFAGMVTTDMARASGLNTQQTSAYWCGDTGGFKGGPPTDELYDRWLEYSTFTPLQEYFGNPSNFPWSFGAQSQQIFQKYAALRYELLPFRYSNALSCYLNNPGSPLYPVWWQSASTNAWNGGSSDSNTTGYYQIMLGHGSSEIFVQPIVYSAGTGSSVAVTVKPALPTGANWIDYWTNTAYAGGSEPQFNYGLSQEPILIKAGSIIPLGPPMQYVGQVALNPLTLDIFPSVPTPAQTSYTYYEDDGVTTAYTGGAFTSTVFTSNNTGAHEVVTIGAVSGTYNGAPTSRNYVLEINLQSTAPSSVTEDGAALTKCTTMSAFNSASSGWYHQSSPRIVWVKFTLATSASATVAL